MGEARHPGVATTDMPNIRFVRYADDWCVCLRRCNRQQAERLMDEIRDFLRKTCGLELSAEKTRITHLRDGYDFLGFNISLGAGRTGCSCPKIKVGRKAITNIQALGEALRYRPTQESISVCLVRSSAVIRGRSYDFKVAHNFKQVAQRVGLHGFLDDGKNDMPEGRHIDCQVSPPLRHLKDPRGSRELYPVRSRIRPRHITYVAEAVPTWQPQTGAEDDESGKPLSSLRSSSARTWRPQVEGFDSATAFTAVAAVRGNIQDLARGSHRTCQPLCQPREAK